MLDFKIVKDAKSKRMVLETGLSGKLLLTTPQLNKGTAFTLEERKEFGLTGKLPIHIETLEQQARRCYLQFQAFADDVNRNIYLQRLHDLNVVLFYKLLQDHLVEMLPIIYTPFVGTSVRHFSRSFRQTRGLYIGYPNLNEIEDILDNRSNPEIDLIVVSDGEGVLGIGDQGIGGMDIPVAKLIVYTLCAGIVPYRTLPIFLDVGTNNQTVLEDPLYLGWHHKRITGQKYYDFIDRFVMAVKNKFPQAFLHWEDFGRANADTILQRYRHDVCSFNDDAQGTGAVVLAAVLAAGRANHQQFTEHRFVIFGGGTAGIGIASQLMRALMHYGLSEQESMQRFWIVDRPGLLTTNLLRLTSGQQQFARNPKEIEDWIKITSDQPQLLDVIHNVKPTVLIGCSGSYGAFSAEIVRAMAAQTERPIILPLSNPPENCEATPQDIYSYTQGNVFMATGSPFPTVEHAGRTLMIAQCNNALVFPGIGLGVLAVKPREISDGMLLAASHALADCAPVLRQSYLPILPLIEETLASSQKVALAVAKQAIHEGLNRIDIDVDSLEEHIASLMWQPQYMPYKLSPK